MSNTPRQLSEAIITADRFTLAAASQQRRAPSFQAKRFCVDVALVRDNLAFADDYRERRIAELALSGCGCPFATAPRMRCALWDWRVP